MKKIACDVDPSAPKRRIYTITGRMHRRFPSSNHPPRGFTMQRVSLFSLLLAGLLVAAPAIAQPCTTNWTDPLGGDWNDAANWSGLAVPGPGDDACVTLAGTYTVSHTSGLTIDVNSITFGAASGTQTLDTSQGIMIASASSVGANGVMEWSDGFLSGGATLTVAGEMVLDGTNFNSRGVVDPGTVLRTEGSVLWTNQEFTLRDGGIWENTSTLTADLGGNTELRQDVLNGNLFDNTGTVNVIAGTLFIRADARHDGAVLTASTGGTLNLASGTHTFAGTTTGSPDGDVILSASLEAEAGAMWNLGGTGLQWRDGFLRTGTVTNDGLVVLNGGNFNSRGIDSLSVFINDASVSWTNDEFTLFDGGTWINNGTLTATLTGSTELRRGGLVGESFDNNGTVNVTSGTLNLRTDARHDNAILTADAGAELILASGTHTFAGTTTGAPDGDVVLSADAVAEAGASWDFGGEGLQWRDRFLEAGTMTNDGLVVLNGNNFNSRGISGATTEFVNAGSVLWTAQEFTLFDGGTWTNNGTLATNNAASTLNLRRGGLVGELFDNAGIVRADSGRFDVNVPFNHQAGALIQGTDEIDILGSTFTHEGDTGPGASPGLLTWTGAWAPDIASTLFIELGGTTPGDDYDQLAVSGAATVDGILDLSIAVGDAPGIGDTFTILTAGGGVTGTFDSVVPAFGYTFDVTYNASDIVVEVLTVPNFDLVAINTDPTGDPIVVAKPGAIDFSYVVTNNTNAPITGDVFFTASLGATTLAQGTIISGTLPANSSSPTLSFTQGIPGIAPVGTYTYSIKIGQFPSVVVDQVDFTVQVVSGSRETEASEEVWGVREATPWLAADGAVLMTVPEQTEARETEEIAEAASSAVPEAFGLAAAYPNPFRASTTFALDVPEAAHVSVAVYDALGRRVAMLLDEEVEAGTHRVAFDASALPSGVYLVRATGAGATALQRVTLVR